MSFFPCLVRAVASSGESRFGLGHPLLDRYLEFVAGRCRPNTLRAVAFDLKTFFSVVEKDPVDVQAADVFEFLAHQRGDRSVVRLSDRESGLSARTIARRLSSVSGFYAYLVARGDTPVAALATATGSSPSGRLLRHRLATSRRDPRAVRRTARAWGRRCSNSIRRRTRSRTARTRQAGFRPVDGGAGEAPRAPPSSRRHRSAAGTRA